MYVLLLLFILVVVLLALYNLRSMRCDVPGPRRWPIIGNGHLFLGDSSTFLQTVSQVVAEHGEIVCAYILSQRYIFITNPKYAEVILSNSEHNTKAFEYTFLHPWLGQGLLTSGGNRWRTFRKFLTPAFHFNILKTFFPIFLKNDKIFIQKLESMADGTPFDIFPVMALLALDNVSEAAMGVCVNAQKDSGSVYVKAVNEISELTFQRMRNMFLRYNTLFNLSPQKRRQHKALSILHKTTADVITNRRRVLDISHTTLENYSADLGIKQKSAFLDLMLLSSVNGNKLDDLTIREEVDTFMFEGHDTTTSALAFTAYNISQNSRVQEKLFEEQKQIFADDLRRHPTYTNLNEMKYLEAAIKESLRLNPSVPFIGRMLTRDTEIGEYLVPKDTSIAIGIIQMQTNPNVFEDPLTFRPERFENMTADQKSAYNWIAFSAGPRNCIGQKFAMMEMKVVLSSLIRRFKLLPSDMKPQLCADLILRSQNGVHLALEPRN